jgi:transposase
MERKKRISSITRKDAVMRVLRGEHIEEVSRSVGVTVAELDDWRNKFIEAGTNGLKMNPAKSQASKYERVIGRLAMENELLKKKHSFANTPGISFHE